MQRKKNSQDISAVLNDALKSDPDKGIFKGGQGVVIRNLNDGLDIIEDCMKQSLKVVPGSFWHNDIWPPNQIYPAFTDIMQGDDDDNWITPTLAVAIGPEHFKDCLFTTSDLQSPDWIDGVWYAHDSNCCDKRGLYASGHNPDGTAYEGYNAPFAWIDLLNPPGFRSSSELGSGTFLPGNPDRGYSGGGTGAHMTSNYYELRDSGVNQVDQVDGKNLDPSCPLVVDQKCQIDYYTWNPATKGLGYEAIDGWMHWIDTFIASAKNPGRQHHDPIEAWVADLAMGWFNNPRPMITLQNALWKFRDAWCTGNSQPPDPNSTLHYWGWNEIPFSKETINNPVNWTCFVIVLPPAQTSLADVLKNQKATANLIAQLDIYKSTYNLHPKESQVVIARQIKNTYSKSPDLVWMREFFVEEIKIGGGWCIDKDGVIREC